MRVYCDDPTVFDSAAARGLQRLVMRVRLGQHHLILSDVDSFCASNFFHQWIAAGDQAEVAELLQRQAPELGDRSLDPAARASGPRAELVAVTTADRACQRDGQHPVWEIDPATAGDWAEAPLRLLVENDNDWVLVACAARVYRRPAALTAEQTRSLLKDQRGGKDEVAKAVERSNPSERVFVLMDSDRESGAGPEGPTQIKVRTLAQTRPHVLPFILRKREAENYVPYEVWSSAAPKGSYYRDRDQDRWAQDRVRARRRWERLSDEEKDHVDMETIFGDAKKQVQKLLDPDLIPDAQTLELRAGTELRELLDVLEAWL